MVPTMATPAWMPMPMRSGAARSSARLLFSPSMRRCISAAPASASRQACREVARQPVQREQAVAAELRVVAAGRAQRRVHLGEELVHARTPRRRAGGPPRASSSRAGRRTSRRPAARGPARRAGAARRRGARRRRQERRDGDVARGRVWQARRTLGGASMRASACASSASGGGQRGRARRRCARGRWCSARGRRTPRRAGCPRRAAPPGSCGRRARGSRARRRDAGW